MIDSSLPQFELVKNAILAGTDRTLRKRFERGEVVRIRSGVYLDRVLWLAMTSDARYRARVAATATATLHGTQFSHDSASALWRLPSLGAWSSDIHILGARTSGGRSHRGLRRHGLGLDDNPITVNDFAITSLARTAVDIACTASFARAICMLDDALRTPERDDFRFAMAIPALTLSALRDELARLNPYYGSVRASRAFDFADGRSASPGESLSRVQMHMLGLPAPELQVPFHDSDGFIGFADFYWPELDAVGEFDGAVKYREKRYLRGRLPEEVVIDEKAREDRMRRVVRAFTRWDWAVANDRRRLAERLGALGLVRLR